MRPCVLWMLAAVLAAGCAEQECETCVPQPEVKSGRGAVARIVTVGGEMTFLTGELVHVGQQAPDFRVVGADLRPVSLADYRGKVLVLASVPSLDTQVCSAETRRFNREAAGLGADVAILVISMDLPFAQQRWCAAEGVDRVVTLSDHREASFGTSYGVLMLDRRLLARAVFVIDRQGIVRHVQVVREVRQEPDYEAVLSAVREADAAASSPAEKPLTGRVEND